MLVLECGATFEERVKSTTGILALVGVRLIGQSCL